MGIKLIRSSPYYAQANGQAEASNQSLIKLIKRKIDEHPRLKRPPIREDLKVLLYQSQEADNTFYYIRWYITVQLYAVMGSEAPLS
jgi:hypothetical protein